MLILLEINTLSTLMEQDFTFQALVVDILFIKINQEIGTLFFQMEQGLTQQALIQENNFILIKMVSCMNLILTKPESISPDLMLEKLLKLILTDTFTP